MVQSKKQTEMQDILTQIGIKMNAQQQEQLLGRVEEREKQQIDNFAILSDFKRNANSQYNAGRTVLLNNFDNGEFVGNINKIKIIPKDAVIDIDYKALVESLPKTKKLLERMEQFKKVIRKESRTITIEKL